MNVARPLASVRWKPRRNSVPAVPSSPEYAPTRRSARRRRLRPRAACTDRRSGDTTNVEARAECLRRRSTPDGSLRMSDRLRSRPGRTGLRWLRLTTTQPAKPLAAAAAVPGARAVGPAAGLPGGGDFSADPLAAYRARTRPRLRAISVCKKHGDHLVLGCRIRPIRRSSSSRSWSRGTGLLWYRCRSCRAPVGRGGARDAPSGVSMTVL